MNPQLLEPASDTDTGSFGSERKEELRLPPTSTGSSLLILFVDVRPLTDPSQAWYWTPEWQAMEAEASDDIAQGRVRRYLNEDEFSRAIDELFSDADV